MEKTSAALIAVSVVLGAVLIIIFTISIVYVVRYRKFIGAVAVAVENDEFCVPQEGPCQLKVDDNLDQPVNITSEFSYQVARYCADLVARVELLFYKKNGLSSLQMPPQLHEQSTLMFHNKIIGYVASSAISKIVWVAFRGTANEAEWRQDFNFSQVDLELSDTENQRTFKLKTGETLACHKGFLNVFNEFKDELICSIKNLNPTQVVISGHSLGASLATLASLELAYQYQVYTYAFASPRVCDFIPPVTSAFWRINNTADVIPDVPLSVMPNLRDKDNPYFYTHGGTAMDFTDNRKSLTNNHLLPVYINAIEKTIIRECALTPP